MKKPPWARSQPHTKHKHNNRQEIRTIWTDTTFFENKFGCSWVVKQLSSWATLVHVFLHNFWLPPNARSWSFCLFWPVCLRTKAYKERVWFTEDFLSFQEFGTSSDTLYRSAWIGVLGLCPLGKRVCVCNPAVTHARSVWKLLGRPRLIFNSLFSVTWYPFSTCPLFYHFLSVLLALYLFFCLPYHIPTSKILVGTVFHFFINVYIPWEIPGKWKKKRHANHFKTFTPIWSPWLNV